MPSSTPANSVHPSAGLSPWASHPLWRMRGLFAGDFLAKVLNFFAFVYLARVLGVTSFGTLGFAISLLTYFLLLADSGTELWSTRQAAQTEHLPELVGRVLPVRFLLALVSFALLFAVLPLLPDYPDLRLVLLLYGLTLFTQASSLKWTLIGKEKLAPVGIGLFLGEAVFAGSVFTVVRGPESLVWVPVLRVLGELATVGYFAVLFARGNGGVALRFALGGTGTMLQPAMTMGASEALSLVNYNFDAVLIGFLLGAAHVGWYTAAYRPVTMSVAMPITFFIGLFPMLSRTFLESREAFAATVTRSLHLAAVLAVPLGIGGTFLAEPIIGLLFGPGFENSVPVLRILCWSGSLVILRGTYRQALNAAGLPRLDLRCAAAAAATNIALNLLLIPRYGMVGAASATIVSDVLWLTMSSYFFRTAVASVSLLAFLLRPLLAGLVMAACLWFTDPLQWVVRGILAVAVYFGTWLLLRDSHWRAQ